MTDAGTGFVRAVLDRAGALGLAWWERLVLILALAILSVAGERVLKLVRFAPIPPEWDPEKGTGPLSPPIVLHQEPPKDNL